MAIHAKVTGWLIACSILKEDEFSWVIKATDEKRSKLISKSDIKNKVFDGENAVGDAEKWMLESRRLRRKK